MARGLALLAALALTLVALPAHADIIVRGSCPDGDPAVVVPWNFLTFETCVPAVVDTCIGDPAPPTCAEVPPQGVGVPSVPPGPALPEFPPELPPVGPLPPIGEVPALPPPADCVVANLTAGDVANATACLNAPVPPVEPPGGVPMLPPPLGCAVENLTAANLEGLATCLNAPAPPVEPPGGIPACLPPGAVPVPGLPDPICVPPEGIEPPGGLPPVQPPEGLPDPVRCVVENLTAGNAEGLATCAAPPEQLACIGPLLADPATFDPASCLPEGTELPAGPVDPCATMSTPDPAPLAPVFAAIDGAAGEGTTDPLESALAPQELPVQPRTLLAGVVCP